MRAPGTPPRAPTPCCEAPLSVYNPCDHLPMVRPSSGCTPPGGFSLTSAVPPPRRSRCLARALNPTYVPESAATAVRDDTRAHRCQPSPRRRRGRCARGRARCVASPSGERYRKECECSAVVWRCMGASAPPLRRPGRGWHRSLGGHRTRPCGLLDASRLRPPPPPLVYHGGLRSCRTAWSGERWSMRFSMCSRGRRHIRWREQQPCVGTAPRGALCGSWRHMGNGMCRASRARGWRAPAAAPSRGKRRRAPPRR